MEIAPLGSCGGSYERASYVVQVGERADAVYAEVRKKVAKYGPRPRSPIHLMLYATDWRFDLGGSVFDLLAHMLGRREHFFTTVVYCRPDPKRKAICRVMFPLSEREIGDLDPESVCRGISEVTFDPRAPITFLKPKESLRPDNGKIDTASDPGPKGDAPT